MTPKFSNPVEEIRDQVKKFDPCELLYYITLLGALPGNEIKCARLDALFKITISTRQKKFKNSGLREEKIEKMLSDLGALYDWSVLEDFTPTPLFEYPEIWVLGKKYNIFSGPQDRAHEFWKELIADYFPVREVFRVKGYDPGEIIKEILSLETTLVGLIRKHKDELYKVGDMMFPSCRLFKSWKFTINNWYQHSPNKDFYEQHSVGLGKKINYENLIDTDFLETTKFFFVRFTHRAVPIFQHNIFSFLNITFLTDFKDIKNQNPSPSYDTSNRLYRSLSKLFPSGKILPRFSIGNSKEVDFAVIFDFDKLLLFKILHSDFVHDWQKHLNGSIETFKKVKGSVSRGKRNFNICGRSAGHLLDIKYETISIVLIKSASAISIGIGTKNRMLNHIFLPIAFVDFLSLSNDVKNGMRFVKFLRRYYEISNRANIVNFGLLDLYAYYVNQNDCFLISDSTPNLLVMPGIWDAYYIKQLKKMPDFQPRLNKNEPDDSWDVDVIMDNIFQVHNNQTRQTAGVFRLKKNRVVWILPSSADMNYNAGELRSFDLLRQLIPYRLVRSDIFEMFLEKISVKSDQQIQFVLYPVSFIKRRGKAHYGFLSKISAELPIIVQTESSQTAKHIFNIFYSIDELSDLFKNNSLGAEKAIIRAILHGMSNLFFPLSHNKIEESLVQIFVNANAAFNFMAVPHPLLLPTSQYANYPKTQQSDTAEIRRQAAEFLSKESIQPGIYKEENAKTIIDKIADFLQASLIKKLHLYDIEEILLYSTHVEGSLLESRAILLESTKRNSAQVREFDSREIYHAENLKISSQFTSTRFVIELIIQTNPQGDSLLTEEKWLEIQALSEEISDAVIKRNTIYFKTGNCVVQIDERHAFQIKEIDINDLIQHSKNLDYETCKIVEATTNRSPPYDGKYDIFQKINPSFFEEFHITFQDFLSVLKCCMYMPMQEKKHTIVVSQPDLISYIQSQCQQIEKGVIINGLELASLTNEDLIDTKIYLADLRNRRLRSIVKPIPFFKKDNQIMCVINSWRIYASTRRWISDVYEGRLPFVINDRRHENIKSGILKKELQTIQQNAAKCHERNVEMIIKQKTQYCDSSIEPNKKCLSGIPELAPGEIDNLSIYPDSKKVIIIDAKNLYWNISPQEIHNEVKKYNEKKGFVAKLLEKMQYVKKHLCSILRHYGIHSFDENWSVEGYIVTSTIAFPMSMPDGIKTIHINELENL